MQRQKVRHRFWLEAVVGAVGVVLGLVTLLTAEWIEFLFGVDPDNGSGLLEWVVSLGLLGAALVSLALATVEWRSTSTA